MTTTIPYSQVYLDNYVHLFSITILFYDHLITLGEEYKQFWQGSRRGSRTLFLLHRYLAFLANITVAYGNLGKFTTPQSCRSYSLYRQAAILVTQIFVATIQFLRTYALYGRSKRIAALLIGVGCTLSGISIWAVVGQDSELSLFQGCHFASSRESATHVAIGWEALFVYDFMIFSLTIYKTYKERVHRSMKGRFNLAALMMRDGALYFAITTIAGGANAITFYVCPPLLRGVLSTTASAISVIMMSRLMLNLRRTAAQHSDMFATTLGSDAIFSNSYELRDRRRTTGLQFAAFHAEDSHQDNASRTVVASCDDHGAVDSHAAASREHGLPRLALNRTFASTV